MTLAELRQECRVRLDDEAAPYLWSDLDLDRYLNEAENEAALRARLLYDTSSALTSIAVVTGTAVYALDPLILAIDTARLTSTGRTLDRTTLPILERSHSDWRSLSGTPRAFLEEERFLQLIPNPTANDTLTLWLWRLPLQAMEDDADEPEIDPRHHNRLIDWVLFRAYSKRDADAEDARRATAAETRFTASFGSRPDANVARKQRIKRVPLCRPEW